MENERQAEHMPQRSSSIRTLLALVYQSALHDYRRQLLMGTIRGQSHMGLRHNYRCERQTLHLSPLSPEANLEQAWSLYQGGGCRAFVLSLTTECQYLTYQVGLGETGCSWGYGTIPRTVLGHHAFLREVCSYWVQLVHEKPGIEPLTNRRVH